jgi:hypothetical protein
LEANTSFVLNESHQRRCLVLFLTYAEVVALAAKRAAAAALKETMVAIACLLVCLLLAHNGA